ncbi:MAG: C40 family peptidase [Mycobacterium pseudokansasii]|uniref:Peptidoglycan endopeptidase RipA n=1 Tax=Mycobacterium pseudokansasii TaxID=2341080 RepID=A0A498QKG1_9MYCO|nr:C40 family peptidase [Mycobacterium pseudokansasii]KZS65757.1 hypothetical protein A4G27_14330 [Mycobacterium kansasii]MBY0387412.1 C40 family peptidase [Mycobacterium pseudokansasii]VAZ87286.1 Peptidoglycan endopeptidase RipA [Mycobacterium pseudokansasii]VAZ87705.1 Peptidoglycan endopeptidase RipA [Mycobacterium pseudokansasii]VBA45570.1 Peptidoglycan endopeptidase RipA [Mycobacterium pseudokansasii]
MNLTEIEVLSRAHQLFDGGGLPPTLNVEKAHHEQLLRRATGLNVDAARGRYERRATDSREALLSAARTDAAVAAVIAGAHRDRDRARQVTGSIVEQARTDVTVTPVTPMAQREAIRRRVARLRAQRAHVLSAHLRARRHRAALRALRYRMLRDGSRAMGDRAGIAVRAALSRLGCPYVWGATGPSQFDCSGLVQWAYAQAGVHLDRTTYQQLHDGIAVPRSQVRPGDLVFPHPGHVQMAIGNNLVVEAPYSGASVRVSRLGSDVRIRRPL